jgi:peptidoglycan/LPS O-acetylase OafA/YrhL
MSLVSRNRNHDRIRLFAASAVVVAHIRAFFFVPFERVEDPTFITEVFYFLTSLGHQAVIVFFVLSGYYVGGSLLNLEKFDFRNFQLYIVARLSRLWIVLVPVIFLTLALIFPICFGSSERCSNLKLSSMSSSVNASLGFDTLLGNILFLQGFKSKIYGGNAPLWSLSYEFWFYIFAFVLLWISASKRFILSFFLIATLVFFSYLFDFGLNWFAWFLIWLLGAISSKISLGRNLNLSPRVFNDFNVTVLLLVFIKLISSNRFEPSNSLLTDMLLGILFSIYLSFSKRQTVKVPNSRRFFPDFSYSLYALHFVLLLGIYLTLPDSSNYLKLNLSWESFFLGSALFFLICIFSFFFSLLTERNTHRLRARFSRLIK